MKLFITNLTFVVIFAFGTVNQCLAQVFNSGNFHVKNNENVYVQGDFTNLSGGSATIQGTIHLEGNWYNNDASSSIINNATGGLVKFVGSVQQINGGTQATKFNNIELDNTNGLLLDQDAEARQVFTFTNGLVYTHANYLITSSTSTSAIVGHGLTRYVVGNLRRYVVGTSAYDLPVGTAANYELAVLQFNSMSGINYINTSFVQSAETSPDWWPSANAIYIFPDVLNPVANPLAVYMSKYSYIAAFLDYGYWTLSPDAITSANYKLTVTERGQSNGGTVAGQHALCKRTDGSSPWGAYGIYAFNSQSGTLTNPITVYMDQLTSFSHFVIGKSDNDFGPLAIELTSFTVKCDNNKVKITWTTDNEQNNDHFTIEKSTDLFHWVEVVRIPGQLSSIGEIKYTAYDDFPWSVLTYYRLKQTDVDGSEHIYSDQWLRYVNCQDDNESWAKILQDEKNNVIINFFTGQSTNFVVHIFDVTGRLLFEKSGLSVAGTNTVVCNLPSVETAVRLVRLRAGTKIYTGKIIRRGN